ncbi:MAG: response regulator [Clostridiales bacterium]|nr:response regulator [Clostridiales bacterium]
MKTKRSLKERLLLICIVIIVTSLLLCTFTIILVRDVLIDDLVKHNESILKLANNQIESSVLIPLRQLELTIKMLEIDSIDKLLEVFLKANPIISNIYVVDEEASVVNIYPENHQAYHWNLSNEPSFFEAENNHWNWSQTYISSITNETVIGVSKKVNDYVVIAELQLKNIPIDIQRQNLFGENVKIEVLDKWGTYIISAIETRVASRYRMSNFNELKKVYSADEHTLEEDAIIFKYNDELSWYILVNYDQEAIDRSIIDWFLIIILIWSVFSIVLVYSILKYFTQSSSDIEIIGNHTNSVAIGDYNLTEKELYFSEFKSLDNQLFNMASIISDRTEEIVTMNENLEKLVNDRTRQLEKTNSKLKEEIIERELVEEEIRQMNHSLDKKVKLRTIELENTNKELNKSIEEAHKANEAKSKFLAVMSHEMRTPLNGIIGFTHMLSLDIKDIEQHKTLELVLSSSKVLLTLINDVLDVSKYEAGKMKFERSPFNYKTEIKEVLDSFKVLSEAKGLEFVILGYDSIDVEVFGDQTKVKQVFYNLLNNALKFTSMGCISVEFKCRLRQNLYVVDTLISDTGIGMKGIDNQLFEPFTQADDSIHRTYGGTGLGLTITKEILNHMSGSIEFEKDVLQGAKCHFTMSLEVNNKVVLLEKSYKNILFVEDHIVNQTLMTRFFEKYSVPYDLAENGLEAVNLFNKNTYDLILMDCQMPVLDGFDATKKIRESDNEIEIIAMTAYTTPEDRKKCFDVGMNDFMTKPIDFKILKKLIGINDSVEVIMEKEITDTIGIYAENLRNKIGFEIQICRDLIETFISQLKKDLNEIDVLKTINDYDQIEKILHKLKGASATVRLDNINNLIEASEDFMLKGNYDESLEIINTIKKNDLLIHTK